MHHVCHHTLTAVGAGCHTSDYPPYLIKMNHWFCAKVNVPLLHLWTLTSSQECLPTPCWPPALSSATPTGPGDSSPASRRPCGSYCPSRPRGPSPAALAFIQRSRRAARRPLRPRPPTPPPKSPSPGLDTSWPPSLHLSTWWNSSSCLTHTLSHR